MFTKQNYSPVDENKCVTPSHGVHVGGEVGRVPLASTAPLRGGDGKGLHAICPMHGLGGWGEAGCGILGIRSHWTN